MIHLSHGLVAHGILRVFEMAARKVYIFDVAHSWQASRLLWGEVVATVGKVLR